MVEKIILICYYITAGKRFIGVVSSTLIGLIFSRLYRHVTFMYTDVSNLSNPCWEKYVELCADSFSYLESSASIKEMRLAVWVGVSSINKAYQCCKGGLPTKVPN